MRECSLEHPERVQKPWHRCLGQKANRRWRTAAPAISVPAPTKTRIYHTVEEADFEQVAYLRAEAYYEVRCCLCVLLHCGVTAHHMRC